MRNMESSHPREVIFLDETWIFFKGNPRKSWQDASTKSVKRPSGYEGKRFIVVHGGGEKGFVDGANLVFTAKSNVGDYHGEMNSENFIQWLKTQLLPNLEEPSLIILDNAPYHSTISEKQPNTSFKKQNIIDWLNTNAIAFPEGATKTELLDIAKVHRKDKQYVVDQIIREYGHDVLRTPPYQCEFNAIELVWAQCKQYYDKHIGRDGNSDENVLALWGESLQQVTPNQWKNYVAHTNKVILEWYEKILIEEIEPIIVNINNTDDSSDSDDFTVDEMSD